MGTCVECGGPLPAASAGPGRPREMFCADPCRSRRTSREYRDRQRRDRQRVSRIDRQLVEVEQQTRALVTETQRLVEALEGEPQRDGEAMVLLRHARQVAVQLVQEGQRVATAAREARR